VGELEARLRAVRDAGGKAFIPYVTGGLPGIDATLLRDLAAVGPDAIEVGIPHSDPIMDGGVIQQASADALEAGATPGGIFATIADAAVAPPVAVMTYANPVERRGEGSFLEDAVAAGVRGVIVPDLPVDEAEGFGEAARSHGVDAVLLAAPGTAEARLKAIAEASRGFIYCVATYGVTGARSELAGTAREIVESLRPLTDLPLLVGVGIGTPEQAAAACDFADGVVVGSALMQRFREAGAAGLVTLASRFREAVPGG
jgi:tryptophan synthase alpha chain